MALHQHFRFWIISDEDTQFYQFTCESIREKIKTKMIDMVESLLNGEDLRATSSSHETEEAVKQDDFFVKVIKRRKTERS